MNERSGHAEDCKSLHPGSIPGDASDRAGADTISGVDTTGTQQCRSLMSKVPALRVSNSPEIAYSRSIVLSIRNPIQELRHTVDLIVVPAAREGRDLGLKLAEPWRLVRYRYALRLNQSRLTRGPHLLFALRNDRDKREVAGVPEILHDLRA